jgi:hypothetical protein
MPHVSRHVKVSHIAKRLLSCELYKSWVSLISQGVEDKDEKRPEGGFSFLVYSWKMMIELKPQVIIINYIDYFKNKVLKKPWRRSGTEGPVGAFHLSLK